MSHRWKNFWTFIITASVAVLLPMTIYKIVRVSMARMVTDDNAGTAFSEFQAALDHGSSVRDPITAAAVANQAYRDKTHGILVDGWGKPMHIYAQMQGTSCDMNIQSAGPNGNFGDGDDVTFEKTFDLSPAKPATNKSHSESAAHASTQK